MKHKKPLYIEGNDSLFESVKLDCYNRYSVSNNNYKRQNKIIKESIIDAGYALWAPSDTSTKTKTQETKNKRKIIVVGH
jgi:hypothetical protein